LTWLAILPLFIQQMVIGLLTGLLLGRLALVMLNHINLSFEGLYSVLSLGLAIFVYGVTAVLGGSGFLAVYLAGLILGNSEFIHKRSIIQFHDGMSWLVGIGMFLILGLLVFPSQLPPIMLPSLALALVLIFIARPMSVFLSLVFSKMPLAEKSMVAWVGLRGAVPITLATFPLLAGVNQSQLIFNVTFFVVLSSVLIQSTTLGVVAKILKVKVPFDDQKPSPLGYTPTGRNRNDLVEIVVPKNSRLVGQRIIDAHIPRDVLVVLIYRDDEYIIPRGSTILQSDDVVQVLGSKVALATFQTQYELKV
jgi:cell volume regulation protein A